MINKSVDNAVLDTVLEKAFADAFEREVQELESLEPAPKEMPEKYRRKERRYYNRKMRSGPRGWTVFGKIAACLLICLGLGLSVMAASPAIRASVWNSVIDFYEKYVSMDFSYGRGKSVTIGDFQLNYVPRGYLLGYVQDTRVGGKYRFVNVDGEYFVVSYYDMEDASSNYSNENGEFKKIELNNIEAYAIDYENGVCSIIWKMNGYQFTIDGSIQYTELKKIAENIS